MWLKLAAAALVAAAIALPAWLATISYFDLVRLDERMSFQVDRCVADPLAGDVDKTVLTDIRYEAPLVKVRASHHSLSDLWRGLLVQTPAWQRFALGQRCQIVSSTWSFEWGLRSMEKALLIFAAIFYPALGILTLRVVPLRRQAMGASRSSVGAGLVGGLLCFLLASGIAWISYSLLGHVLPSQDGFATASLWLALGSVVLAPIGEELFFRHAMLSAAEGSLSRPVAVTLSSAVFIGAHPTVYSEHWMLAIPALASLSLVASILFYRYRGVMAPIVAHIGYNGLLLLVMAIGTRV